MGRHDLRGNIVDMMSEMVGRRKAGIISKIKGRRKYKNINISFGKHACTLKLGLNEQIWSLFRHVT